MLAHSGLNEEQYKRATDKVKSGINDEMNEGHGVAAFAYRWMGPTGRIPKYAMKPITLAVQSVCSYYGSGSITSSGSFMLRSVTALLRNVIKHSTPLEGVVRPNSLVVCVEVMLDFADDILKLGETWVDSELSEYVQTVIKATFVKYASSWVKRLRALGLALIKTCNYCGCKIPPGVMKMINACVGTIEFIINLANGIGTTANQIMLWVSQISKEIRHLSPYLCTVMKSIFYTLIGYMPGRNSGFNEKWNETMDITADHIYGE